MKMMTEGIIYKPIRGHILLQTTIHRKVNLMNKQLKSIVFMLLVLCFTLVLAQPDILAPDEMYQKMQDKHQTMFTQLLDVLPPEAKGEVEALQARRETLDEQLNALHLKAVEVYQNALDQGETPAAADTLARESTADEYTPLINEHNAFKEDMHAFMQSYPEAMAVFKSIDHEPYMQGMRQGMQGSSPTGNAVCPNCPEQGANTTCPNCPGQGSQHMQGMMEGRQGPMHGGNANCPNCSGQGSQHMQGMRQGGNAPCPNCSMQGTQGGSNDCPHCSGQGSQHMQGMMQGKQGPMHGQNTACPNCPTQGVHGIGNQGPMQGVLNGQQINTLFVGHTGYIKTADMEWANIWDGAGNFYAEVSKQGKEEELVGKWSATPNGTYCVSWANANGNRSSSCYKVDKSGNELTLTAASGSSPDTITLNLLPGNPHNLVIP